MPSSLAEKTLPPVQSTPWETQLLHPVPEGTFTDTCVAAVKRIPRGNVLNHIIDAQWNQKRILFPCLVPSFDSKRSPHSWHCPELDFLVVKGKYTKSQIPELAKALVCQLSGFMDHQYGGKDFYLLRVAASLAKCLPPAATVYFRGAHRDDKYFAQLAIEKNYGLICKTSGNSDLFFSRSDRTWFYGLLSLWVKTLEPDREYFPICGAMVARDTLIRWLKDQKVQEFCGPDWEYGEVSFLRSRDEQSKKYGLVNSQHIEDLMRGRVGWQQNSAHNAAVIESNEDALARMNSKLRTAVKPTFSSVQNQILALSRSRADYDDIRHGLTHLAGVIGFVDASNNQLSSASKSSLQTLWAYADKHKNRKVAANLRDATLLQLAIIGRETPCVFGCVGLLLSTLQGVDPAFSAPSDDGQQIKERLLDIAVRVQKQMEKQFEDTEVDELENQGTLNEETLSEIKLQVFRKTVDIELRCFDGIPPGIFEGEANKLEAGFRL